MRLQQLQLLLTLARTGSMRASAEAMNVTQPALTKALKQLEEEFGATLVLRSPKGVRLAPAGEMLAARAATVVREIERAREVWRKKFGQPAVDPAGRAKQMRFLAARGFGSEAIRRVVRGADDD